MKNKINLILLLLLSLSIVSCVDTYDDDFSEQNLQNGWIQFEKPEEAVVLRYQSEVSTVQVILEALNKETTEFTYELEVIDGEANIETGSFQGEILQDQRIGLIEVPVDLEQIVNGYEIRLTIVDVQREGIEIGVAGGDNSSPDHTSASYDLKYAAPFPRNTYQGVAFTDGDSITSFEVDLIEIEDRVFTMTTLWGPDFVASITGDASLAGQFVYPGELTVLEDGLSVSLEGTDTSLSDPDDPDSPLRFPGSIDEDVNLIDARPETISYTLEQNLFGADFEVEVVLTPLDLIEDDEEDND